LVLYRRLDAASRVVQSLACAIGVEAIAY